MNSTIYKVVIIFVCIFLSIPAVFALYPRATYTLQENGIVEVNLSVAPNQANKITLPTDVQDQEVQVVQDNENNTSSSVQISYTTGYLTRKERGIWYFESVNNSANYIELTFPDTIQIVRSNPPASIKQGENLIFYWENASTPVEVSYVFSHTKNGEAVEKEQSQSIPATILIILVVFGTVGITILVMHNLHKKGMPTTTQAMHHEQFQNPKDEKPNITEGQMTVLRTANKNASHVISLLLKHNGHLKRNTLETESGLAKSSLASTLNSLEKKGIITVDRSFHTHYIKLSDWFSSL